MQVCVSFGSKNYKVPVLIPEYVTVLTILTDTMRKRICGLQETEFVVKKRKNNNYTLYIYRFRPDLNKNYVQYNRHCWPLILKLKSTFNSTFYMYNTFVGMCIKVYGPLKIHKAMGVISKALTPYYTPVSHQLIFFFSHFTSCIL